MPSYLPRVPEYKHGNKKPDATPYPLTDEEVSALNAMAKTLNIQAEWIYKMILWESGWYATIGLYNKNGSLTKGEYAYVGLQQIALIGLKGLQTHYPDRYGKYRTQQELILAFPTRTAQLKGPVLDYFKINIKVYGHPKSFAMLYTLNFYPAYFKYGPNHVLPPKIQKQNGGVKTVGELANRAEAKALIYPYTYNAKGGSTEVVAPEVVESKKEENKPKKTPEPKKKPPAKKKTSKPKSTHHTGKYSAAVKAVMSKAIGNKGVGGVFYSIFTQNGFYDVADINNGLTVEQRAQVPLVNQYRFSQMSNAIAEMIHFVLGDTQFGVLTNTAQGIADSLDMRSTANAAQINTIGSGFAAATAVPVIGQYLASIDSARKFTEHATVTSMGGSMADPTLIPPTVSGAISVISPIGNLLSKGFVKPDINFIYQYESTKSSKVYDVGGKYAIGTQIILYDGSANYQVVLKQIFGLVGVDSNMNAVGSPAYGINADVYDTLISIADKPVGGLDAVLDAKKNSIKLSDDQMRAAFNQWFMYKFWNVLTDSGSTLYAHWGFLTNNSLPADVRTAVSSYVWSTKSFTLTPGENDVAAYLSYFVQIGLYYLIGYPNPAKLTGLGYVVKEVNNTYMAQYLDDNGNMKLVPNGETITTKNAFQKNENIAKAYFRWAAYAIVLTTTSEPRLEDSFRRQRMAEAAMILKYASNLSGNSLVYGDVMSVDIAVEMGRDNFHNAIRDPIYRYSNTLSAGTTGTLLPNTSAITVTYQSQVQKTDSNGWVLPGTIDGLKQIAKLSGVTELSISNTVQSAQELAQDLFNLEESGTQLQYAAPAQHVVDSYRIAKSTNLLAVMDLTANKMVEGTVSAGLSKTYKSGESVNANDKVLLIDIILNQIKEEGAYNVSKHATDSQARYHSRQVLDISNSSSKPVSAMAQFKSRVKGIYNDQQNPYNLVAYTEASAKNESSNHLEFSNPSAVGAPLNNALPDVKFNGITNSNYTRDGWYAVFNADMNRVNAANIPRTW